MSRILNVYELHKAILINEFNGIRLDKQKVLVIERADKSREMINMLDGTDLTNSNLKIALDKNKTKLKRIFNIKDFQN